MVYSTFTHGVQYIHPLEICSIPDTALIEKESVKHFALSNSQPQVIHVQVLHIKKVEGGEAQAGGGEKIHHSLVDWPRFVVQPVQRD